MDNPVDSRDDGAGVSGFDVPHLRIAGMIVLAFMLAVVIAAMVGIVHQVRP